MAPAPDTFTVNALAAILPPSARTWNKYLADVEPARVEKRSRYYRLADAIKAIPPHLLGISPADVDELDITYESARLKKEQADEKALTNETLRGNLVRIEEIEENWADIVSAFRAKLLSMPSALCAVLVGLSMREIETEMREYLHNAMGDLAGGDGGKWAGNGQTASKNVCDDGPAARLNG
jgi:phage terminase Nu1 subunit (DNA packaging protein)